MSNLLEIVGQGLLTELSAAFRDVLADGDDRTTSQLRDALQSPEAGTADYLAMGARLLHERDLVGARAMYQNAADATPQDVTARIGLACALDDLSRTSEAIAHLAAALSVQPKSAPLLFATAYCHERAGHLLDAVGFYIAALDACPGLRNAHERLAAIYVKQGAFEGATRHYEKLAAADPADVGVLLALGNLYYRLARYDDAIDRYRRALVAKPDQAAARSDLAQAYEKAGHTDQAIAELTDLVEAGDGAANHHVRLGDLHAQQGDEAAAIRLYEQAVQIQPDALDAVVKLGTLHLRRGRYPEAAKWFVQAIEINDRVLTAYVGLGVAQHENGQLDEAYESFEIAADIEPNSTLLFTEVAKLQLKMAATREADHILAPARPSIRGTKSQAPVDDLLDRQIKRHRQVLNRRPNHADLHYRLGLLLRQRGQLDAAIDSFRQAVAINPNYVKAVIKLGLALTERGDFDEAVGVLRQALDDRPRDVELHYRLGLMFADRNEFSMALEQYEVAIREDPRNIDLHANLALALQNMGLLDRAALSWETLCEVAAETRNGRAVLDAAAGRCTFDDD